MTQLGFDARLVFDDRIEERAELGELGIDDGSDPELAASLGGRMSGGLPEIRGRRRDLLGLCGQKRPVAREFETACGATNRGDSVPAASCLS
ncbi:hypothetical protein GCM10011390_26600 [Aureimonas endophytica]|uniref:Uncharacterized protein n=2 Tax=Aureimonas endophytica TaxID=2027858 RepID=A0A916ZNI8_9HYPH|nr:hypothetical protein GCM10011390_26600 [Aureimonas endophytica]